MPRKPYRAPAHWYDAENERHDVLKQDVPFFMGQLPAKRQSILELACGTGRAAIPLALAGHRVTGIDYAPEMIDLARAKRDASGLTEKQLRLDVGDMLNLDLGERFDWVCVFFNTFCNFTTLDLQDRVLANAVKHLKPNGRFWLDVYNPDPNLLADPHAVGRDPYAFRTDDGTTVFFSTDVKRGAEPQLQHVIHRYEWFDAAGKRRRATHAFDMTFFYPRELQLLVERHGLEVEHVWGNYDASPVTPDAPRIVLRCCRK
ncbi:MAG TPA: class I SAM-dependent methyltransferase [Humisphaera sp.]